MADAIKATIAIMDSPSEKIKIRTSYNISGLHFSPEELAKKIKQYFSDFIIKYDPDKRDLLASSWPNSIDDSCARKDWGWSPNYDLSKMVDYIILNLKKKYKQEII